MIPVLINNLAAARRRQEKPCLPPILFLIGLLAAGCGETSVDGAADSGASSAGGDASLPAGNVSCGPARAKVVAVTDGDTITIEGGEKIRYLMVDTPETTKGAADCYGLEAKEFNKSLVLNQEISLVYDKVCRDRYNRLLAYVYLNNRELNTLLVERGYACVLHIPPNGDDRAGEFKKIQDSARNAKMGMWGSCSEIACLK
ncbi:MAG: hypothetical protein GMKNLPBB_02939 [Myxococcota bacterium]|nr:hypothetical protein [Myxococcota bacterium]